MQQQARAEGMICALSIDAYDLVKRLYRYGFTMAQSLLHLHRLELPATGLQTL